MKIAVLMSGGIDSSFAAFYLKEKGYDIVGVNFLNTEKSCEEAEGRARKIAKFLSIPYFVLDLRNVFEEEIKEPFYSAFRRGETPNPCPFCNRLIKFGVALEKVKKLGVEKLASGHYVKSGYSRKEERWFLRKADDRTKDQSYFLWNLSQEQISRALFPLGVFYKKDIKKIMMEKFSGIFSKESYKESQNICFLKGRKLSEFLKERLGEKEGPILDERGSKIGTHQGLHLFTVGQRAGLGIGARSPFQAPLYVLGYQKEKNVVIVGREKSLFKKETRVQKINWVSIPALADKIKAKVRIRYRHQEAEAEIQPVASNKSRIVFKIPQRAITPGQHAVFYKKDTLLGGGVFE
ncbi:MAG: tRNA 2-thiouridine(34) synthase MnmA [Patescibacteria group bacterium]